MKTRIGNGAALAATLLTAFASVATAQSASEDNGTDPTKLSRNIYSSFEFRDIEGFSVDTFVLRYGQPIWDGRSSVTVRVPVVATDIFSDSDTGIGDVSLKFTHVPVVNRQFGVVLAAELSLDTADGADQGAGLDVLKLTGTYARFLPNHAIFAPSIVHSFGLTDPDAGRSDVSFTTLDFYYVPKLPGPYYMTIDPSVNINWENDTSFTALAVTFGRGIDLGLPGNMSVFIKPQAAFGSERSFARSVEVGLKTVGF